MATAEYYRRWRAAHPEYRERERIRSRARKRTKEQRQAERARARARAVKVDRPEVEPMVDPIVAWARECAERIIRPDRRVYLMDGLYEEVVSELLFARAVRDEDPIKSAKRWLSKEYDWRNRHITGKPVPLTQE